TVSRRQPGPVDGRAGLSISTARRVACDPAHEATRKPMTRFLHYAVLAAGLAVVAWVGAGYLGNNLLALAITLAIAAFYLIGAVELQRLRQATDSLRAALATLSTPPASLPDWIASLHPSL